MKILSNKILMILFTAIELYSCGSSIEKSDYVLLEENQNGKYHSIYIDTNKESKYFEQISNFNFDSFDQETYSKNLVYFKVYNLKLNKMVINNFPKEWISLKQYKGKYYTYRPSDLMYHRKLKITDSTIIEFIEGALPSKILSYDLKDNKTIHFRLIGINGNNRELTIQIIDMENGIAVFTDSENDREKVYDLMIAVEKIKKFPIIVNFCESEKRAEFDKFDEPNYKQLIDQ